MDSERRGIVATYDLLHEAIQKTYDSLLVNLDTQFAGTDRQLRAQVENQSESSYNMTDYPPLTAQLPGNYVADSSDAPHHVHHVLQHSKQV